MDRSNNKLSEKTPERSTAERVDGKLPVIDIAGHPFYVDVRMRMLRPHDDFSSRGIPFSSFDQHEKSEDYAWIPYDPLKHEVKEVDILNLTEIPKDWIIVEIAQPWLLDPYGYAREHGFHLTEEKKESLIPQNLQTRVVNWEEAGFPDLIKENIEAIQSAQLSQQKGRHHQIPELKKGRRR